MGKEEEEGEISGFFPRLISGLVLFFLLALRLEAAAATAMAGNTMSVFPSHLMHTV